jgi:hypothetical protein
MRKTKGVKPRATILIVPDLVRALAELEAARAPVIRCKDCGKRPDDGDNYCSGCGRELGRQG